MEIEKLDEKYTVLKNEDLERYFSQFTAGIFTTEDERKIINQIPFNTVMEEIKKDRKTLGKTPQKYIVLNLNDTVNLFYLIEMLKNTAMKNEEPNKIKVDDIAVLLVNAILRSDER